MSHPAHAARIFAFNSWFLANGGYISPLTEFVHSPQNGIFLRAKPTNEHPIPKGELVVSCPHSLTLSALNAADKSSQFERNPRRGHGRLAPSLPESLLQVAKRQTVAATWLCVQFLSRQQHRSYADFEGPYDAYLDILPMMPLPEGDSSMSIDDDVDVIDTPMWWTEEEIGWIAGTNLEKGIRDLGEHWRHEWEKWRDEITAWSTANGLQITWRLFKWALTILGSRSFSSKLAAPVLNSSGNHLISDYDPEMLLYPGIDMLNHSATTTNRWSTDQNAFGLLCDDEVGPGQEIFNSYGGKGNSELLLSFGFCLNSNPHDSFDLKLPDRSVPLIEAVKEVNSAKSHESETPESSNITASYFSPDGTVQPNRAPPASIPEHSLYSIRSLQFINTSHRRSGFGEPLTSRDESWISTIPEDLLNVLSASLANQRETAHIMANINGISVNKLYQHFSGRNRLAVANLLLERLRVEQGKLFETTTITSHDPKPSSIDNADTTIRDRRKYYAHIYGESKARILQENTASIEEFMNKMLTGDESQHPSSRQMVPRIFPYALTLTRAIESLRNLPMDVQTNFVTGISQVLKLVDITSGDAILEGPWDVWALWLGVVLSFNREIRIQNSADPVTAMEVRANEESREEHHRSLHPALYRWCTFINEQYRPFDQAPAAIAPPPPDTSDPTNAEPPDQDDELAHELGAHVLKLRQVSPQNPLWNAQQWPPGMLRTLVEILQEESIDIAVRGARGEAIKATVFWVGVD